MSAFQRQSGIMKELSQMVRDYVFRTVLKKAPKERIEEMLKTVKCHKSVEVFRDGSEFGFYDLLDLVDAAGIDIGLTIRVRDGEEITFYPGHNFGGTGGKNGTPQEKRAAKKPYEPYVAPTYVAPQHDYRAGRGRNGVQTPALTPAATVTPISHNSPPLASPAWHQQRRAAMKKSQAAENLALDDGDDDLYEYDGFGQVVGPKLPKPEPVALSPATNACAKKGEVVDLRMVGRALDDYDDG
jgi:hypothetical protein